MRIAVMILSLGLMLVVGFQSCAATVGGNLDHNESTTTAGAMGFFVVFLYLIDGAFAISFLLVSLVTFLIAGTIAIAVGLSSEFADLAIWGFVALILAVMIYFGHREKHREKHRRRAEQLAGQVV
jgi:hypothetical protein